MERPPNPTDRRAFSMIEMVIVITIVTIAAAIVTPRFVDASSGRRLSAASKTLESDIELITRRARLRSKTHTIAFYPGRNLFVAFEGDAIDKDAIVFARDFDDEPFLIDIFDTTLADDHVAVTPYGDLGKAFTVRLEDDGIKVAIVFNGLTNRTIPVNLTDTGVDIDAGVLQLSAGVGGVSLDLGGLP